MTQQNSNSLERETFRELFKLIQEALLKEYQEDFSKQEELVISLFEAPKDIEDSHEWGLPTFLIAKNLAKKKPKELNFVQFCAKLSEQIATYIKEAINKEPHPIIHDIANAGPYVNFFFKASYLAKVINLIKEEKFLEKGAPTNETVIIEYSQPNTHKTFHVGHMRNAALGNSLVLLFEHVGHKVIAANYIGDVGTHIAKCLWFYLYHYKECTGDIEKDVPKDIPRVEWLGELYSKACEYLDFEQWTQFPHIGIITAKVLKVEDHPSNKAWKVVTVSNGKEEIVVVCGGKGYKVGDIVPFAPLGSKAGGRLITEQDKKGVTSRGMILSEKELGVDNEKSEKGKIYIFPEGTQVGAFVTEVGRKENNYIGKDVDIAEEMQKRTKQVKDVLQKLESNDPEMHKLWTITRQWCLDDFKKIYDWVGCRFDHYFHESDVGEESKKLVLDAYEKGILTKSDGTIGADLSKHKLGWCMLLTSAGTGLYATKDLALAKKKFEDFHVDRSVYVVDAGQSLHFQQVFKTLEILGFKQAKKCFHLAYGIVTLPEGKMSSRKGSIITFSVLRNLLMKKIYEEYMKKYEGDWSKEEIEETTRKLAISVIKYGMLNQDNKKDIIFDLNEWTSRTGNTGTYLMYAYARLSSILRKIDLKPEQAKLANYALLQHESERKLLSVLNAFPGVVAKAVDQYKPQQICIYVYNLSKQISRMYDSVPVKHAETPELVATRAALVEAAGQVLKKGLNLLGIETVERM